MEIKIQRSPKEIEKRFNKIREEINKAVLSVNDFRLPDIKILDQLEIEYKKIAEEYSSRIDRKNLLHVTHNFYWSLIFKYLKKDPTKALEFFLKALDTLLKRNCEFPYQPKIMERMLGTYELAIIKISEEDGIYYDEILEKFEKLIDIQISKIKEPRERLIQILNILWGILSKNISEKIKTIHISFKDNKELFSYSIFLILLKICWLKLSV